MSKKIIWFEPGRCWGCGNCVARCAELHNGTPACSVTMAGFLPIPLRCMHCTDALCMEACPVGAIERKGDAVVINYNQCKGCGLCVLACPFGAISFDEKSKKPIKCDLCIERIEKGELPVCVEACPSHTLVFTDINELVKKHQEKTAFLLKFLSTKDVEDLVSALYTPSPLEMSKQMSEG